MDFILLPVLLGLAAEFVGSKIVGKFISIYIQLISIQLAPLAEAKKHNREFWCSPYLPTADRDSLSREITFLENIYYFWASIQCFLREYRPKIGLDGAHLKGKFKGIIISTIALTGNKSIFLVANGVIE